MSCRWMIPITQHHPFSPSNELEEVASGVAFVQSFANVAAIDTGEGLCLVDTGSAFSANLIHDAIRRWTSIFAASNGM